MTLVPDDQSLAPADETVLDIWNSMHSSRKRGDSSLSMADCIPNLTFERVIATCADLSSKWGKPIHLARIVTRAERKP